MTSAKTLKSIEYDKILSALSEFAVLNSTKKQILEFVPATDIKEAEFLLKKTEEAYKLLFVYSVGGIFFFDDVFEQLLRVDKGGTLTAEEILKVAENLKGARLLKSSISAVKDQTLTIIPEIASRIYVNPDFEKEVFSKIISEDEIADNASQRLFSIRKSIREINVKIRDQLNSYMRGNMSKYLQDGVVTMRQDRFVIPVKSEYRSFVKGFIHDQSSTGSTVFIEPEQVMELNNDLKKATFDEAEEIHKILVDLSSKISYMSDGIRYNAENVEEIDLCFARAEYSFKNKCSKPLLNNSGIIDIKKGRHPLISLEKVVPVSLTLGEDYNFLLVTGPNTGGKTVTLKLCGLFSLMASSGLYIPAEEESKVAVFNGVYCDIGDEQSIEQNLSTFSSHITNIINILNSIDNNSLVLLDELGAGTDPEEGSALALSVIEKLLDMNCFGIITTHYSKLKEYAVSSRKIENASMEFDVKTLKPLYRLNIGIPGSSNAIDIAKTLGLSTDIIEKALLNLSSEKINFEGIIKKAEESRREAEILKQQLDELKVIKEQEVRQNSEEKEKLIKERERISFNAKQETKRIVSDKLQEAEEIISELKNILKTVGLESKELFRAGELKNRLANSRYLETDLDNSPIELKKAEYNDLKEGNRVFVKSLGTYAKIISVKKNKKEVEVFVGDIRTVVKVEDLYNSEKVKDDNKVKVNKKTAGFIPKTELNVVGKTSLEALQEVENFVDQAIMYNIEEIKIIHGIGTKTLLNAIREYLKNNKDILEFRAGKYGEGENGVTIAKLK